MEEHNPTRSRARWRSHPHWERPTPSHGANTWKELGRKAAALKIAKTSGDWLTSAHFDSDIGVAWGAPSNVVFRSDSGIVRQLARLKQRVDHLEDLLGLTGEPFAEDRYIAWCEANRNVLRRYSNSYVAIDLEKGAVVASGKSQQEFTAALKGLSKEYLRSLFQTHTGLFV